MLQFVPSMTYLKLPHSRQILLVLFIIKVKILILLVRDSMES